MYLCSTSTPATRAAWADGRLGCLLIPDHGDRRNQIAGVRHWAADNGCYAKGAAFDLAGYLRWLELLGPARCLFATAPDVVGDAAATWERSAPVLPILRSLGFPAAYVAQDGLDPTTLDWDAFDTLFVGGSTAYKLSEMAYDTAREAKRRGKWCHMGRVNSERRLRAAAVSGYDSADGTMLAFGPDKQLRLLLGWLDRLERQATLPWGDAAD